MSSATCNKIWDDVWLEFDARQKVQPKAESPGPMQAPARETNQPALLNVTAEAVVAKKGLGRFMRGVAVIIGSAFAFYVGSPVASAVQFAAAIQRGDAAALAHHIDWPSLRPALDAALAAEVQRNDTQPMPSFIAGMAQDIAERLSPPEGLAIMLNERMAANGVQPAREIFSRVRMLEAGLWQVTLPLPNMLDRSAKLTLALTDVARLRWEVQAVDLPARLPPRFR